MVQQGIEGIVAHESTGRVGYSAGKSGILDRQCHFYHRNGSKQSIRAIWYDWFFLRLVACVVCNSGAAHIDTDPLRGHRSAPASLSDAQDHIGIHLRCLL